MTPPLLFTPLCIRGIKLKNRIMISPMATYSGTDGAVKRETGMATIAVGLIFDPHHAEKILRDGGSDVVAIGRELP